MHTGEAERLVRWAASVEQLRKEAEAQLARPLSSPGLRCARALVQAVRLGRAIGEGAGVATLGVVSMRAYARAGQRAEALQLGRQVAACLGTLGRAGDSLLRTCFRAWQESRLVGSASGRPCQRSPIQQIRRALTLGRAAWFAWGGIRHDRR